MLGVDIPVMPTHNTFQSLKKSSHSKYIKHLSAISYGLWRVSLHRREMWFRTPLMWFNVNSLSLATLPITGQGDVYGGEAHSVWLKCFVILNGIAGHCSQHSAAPDTVPRLSVSCLDSFILGLSYCGRRPILCAGRLTFCPLKVTWWQSVNRA